MRLNHLPYRLYRSFSAFLGLLGVLTIYYSCASIQLGGPAGGPKDSLPPQLTKTNPFNNTVNFSGNKISFTFDEFVEVQNLQENLVVSPNPKVAPVIDAKLKTLTIKLKDTLEENTTYFINFGNAIRDINEGNILKNFTYTFSTGKKIDSLTLKGSVIIAETGTADSTLIVLLYKSLDDSAVAKERPRYYTRTDGKGGFSFRFLPPGKYNVFALKDADGDKRYSQPTELFAFADEPVVLGENGDEEPVELAAFASEKEKPAAGSEGTNRPALVAPGTRRVDEAKILRFQTNLSENAQQDLLSNLVITFNHPLKYIDKAKFIFADTAYQPITDYTIEQDSTKKKLTFIYKWKENTPYKFILQKEFAGDTLGNNYPRTDTVTVTTKKESAYGTLKIKFSNYKESDHIILQFVKSGEVVNSIPVTSAIIQRKLFNTGEYDLRVLYDANQNGKWDPGSYFKDRKQPEKVIPLSQKLNIKANWDNERTIAL
jgi:Bacterial Ig-like domain